MKTEKIWKSDLWTTQSWKKLLICWISNQKVESVIKKLNVVEFAFGWEQLCGSYQFYNKILTMVEKFWKLTMQHAGTMSKDWFIVKNSKEFPWITRQRESNWRREVVDPMYSCGEPSWWKGFYLCLSLNKKPKINSSRNTVHCRSFSVCVCVCVCVLDLQLLSCHCWVIFLHTIYQDNVSFPSCVLVPPPSWIEIQRSVPGLYVLLSSFLSLPIPLIDCVF